MFCWTIHIEHVNIVSTKNWTLETYHNNFFHVIKHLVIITWRWIQARRGVGGRVHGMKTKRKLRGRDPWPSYLIWKWMGRANYNLISILAYLANMFKLGMTCHNWDETFAKFANLMDNFIGLKPLVQCLVTTLHVIPRSKIDHFQEDCKASHVFNWQTTYPTFLGCLLFAQFWKFITNYLHKCVIYVILIFVLFFNLHFNYFCKY
jgi:hypothetical protein